MMELLFKNWNVFDLHRKLCSAPHFHGIWKIISNQYANYIHENFQPTLFHTHTHNRHWNSHLWFGVRFMSTETVSKFHPSASLWCFNCYVLRNLNWFQVSLKLEVHFNNDFFRLRFERIKWWWTNHRKAVILNRINNEVEITNDWWLSQIRNSEFWKVPNWFEYSEFQQFSFIPFAWVSIFNLNWDNAIHLSEWEKTPNIRQFQWNEPLQHEEEGIWTIHFVSYSNYDA